MKDLKVRLWKSRNYWVIDARRVGYSHAFGNYETKQEAVEEAGILKAKFLTGSLIERTEMSIDQQEKSAIAALEAEAEALETERIGYE